MSSQITNEKCFVCADNIDLSKIYVHEEVTVWNNDKGKAEEKYYHRLCYLRSRR